jgi:hypothetical protein
VGDLLNDFLRGGISAANYWEQWRRSQNWTGPRYDPWRVDDDRRSRRRDDDDDDDDDRRYRRRDDDDDDDRRDSPWGGAFEWPDTSFAGGRRSGRSGGGWGRLPGLGGGGFGGGFSRPRGGSMGGGGFKTGGGFKAGGGFKTGGRM